MTRILPSDYDEAQERLEELKERWQLAEFQLNEKVIDFVDALSNKEVAQRARDRAREAYITKLEEIAAAAAAEKAVRG